MEEKFAFLESTVWIKHLRDQIIGGQMHSIHFRSGLIPVKAQTELPLFVVHYLFHPLLIFEVLGRMKEEIAVKTNPGVLVSPLRSQNNVNRQHCIVQQRVVARPSWPCFHGLEARATKQTHQA